MKERKLKKGKDERKKERKKDWTQEEERKCSWALQSEVAAQELNKIYFCLRKTLWRNCGNKKEGEEVISGTVKDYFQKEMYMYIRE